VEHLVEVGHGKGGRGHDRGIGHRAPGHPPLRRSGHPRG
jgi:hypothetical protein